MKAEEIRRPRYQTIPLTQPVSWAGFILHVFANNPSRIFDQAERQVWIDRYWSRNPRLEAQQWRRAGSHAPVAKEAA